MRAVLTGAAVLFAAGAAMAGDLRMASSRGAEILGKYKPTGETLSCLPVRQIDSMKFVEDSVILVETHSGKVYFNQTSNDCNGARANTFIAYSTTGPTLCRNEIVRVIDNSSGAFMGSCAIGSFDRVEKKTEG